MTEYFITPMEKKNYQDGYKKAINDCIEILQFYTKLKSMEEMHTINRCIESIRGLEKAGKE